VRYTQLLNAALLASDMGAHQTSAAGLPPHVAKPRLPALRSQSLDPHLTRRYACRARNWERNTERPRCAATLGL